MPSRRCEMGCESWPIGLEYRVCPVCQEPTSIVSNDEAIPDDEAEIRKSYADFEHFYEAWDEAHGPERLLLD